MFDKLTSLFSRIFFGIALVFLAIAVLGRVIRFFDPSTNFLGYDPGRLFEFSGIFLLFVLTLLLRQIRELLKK